MATNDGFSPYPIGLTAAESVAAILRAHNLSIEFGGFVAYTDDDTAPLLADSKNGDLWNKTAVGTIYRASVDLDTPTLIWFEV